MGGYIVGLTLNWDIKAILCFGFHFSTSGMTYKIKPYKHTYQPRTLPLEGIVSRVSFHLAVSPRWNCHCEQLCYSWVCVVIFLQEGVCFCPWLTFSFFFSSFCLPPCWYQPDLFCLHLFFYFRELFREDAAHRTRTPSKLSTAQWDVRPEKTCSRRCCCCWPSLQLTTKGEPTPFWIFCQRWFSGNEQNNWFSVCLFRCKNDQKNDGRLQKSRGLTLT